jgi:drug/metabolite transporter (DMT)-like permease
VLFSVVQFAVVAATALLGAAIFEAITLQGLRGALPNILYVGLLSTAISFTILTFALRATSPSEAAIIIMTETLFAAFGAWLVFNERVTFAGALGAAAILSAAMLVQLQQVRNASRK